MPIFTALSTFAEKTLTAPKSCKGCGKTHPAGALALVKSYRDEEDLDANFNNIVTIILCRDEAQQCWQTFDQNYWEKVTKTN